MAQPKITNNGNEPIDQALKSTWVHRAWFGSGCTMVLIALAKSIIGSVDTQSWVKPILATFFGYILSDLATGVYHWCIDNYGNAKTPIFGPQIEGFQGHHEKPWIITKQEIANNLHELAQLTTLVILPINLICNDPSLMAFIGSFSGCILFCQQFHAWSHLTKNKLPYIVVALQDLGVLLSRSQHAAHHHLPYNNNYCIVSGIWNKFLDKYKIFDGLETVIFFLFEVKPRSWN